MRRKPPHLEGRGGKNLVGVQAPCPYSPPPAFQLLPPVTSYKTSDRRASFTPKAM